MRPALVLALLVVPAAAAADEHVVHEGETLAQIANLYYGDGDAGVVVLARANGLPEDAVALVPGQRLVVPVPRTTAVAAGETWEAIAERTLGERRRAAVLARANRADADAPPEIGTEVVVPILLTHVPDGRETVPTIAKRYYGAARGAVKLLRDFNDLRLGRPAADRPLLVPFPDLRLSPAGRETLARARGAENDGRAQAQAEIAAALPALDDLYREGRYLELVASASGLVGRPEATGNQLVTLRRLLAYAYVALGRDDLALESFREALRNQPDLELNAITTSPKILRVLREARRAPESRPTP